MTTIAVQKLFYLNSITLCFDFAVVGDDLDVNDIHLLMEYKSGDKWGRFTSPRANRYCSVI